jgi:hypothetical protein
MPAMASGRMRRSNSVRQRTEMLPRPSQDGGSRYSQQREYCAPVRGPHDPLMGPSSDASEVVMELAVVVLSPFVAVARP